MKCPHCEKEGKISKLYCGGGTTTAMYSTPYFDEKGDYHHHDCNVSYYSYSCSNGHQFSQASYHSCWCGWSNDPNKENKEDAD